MWGLNLTAGISVASRSESNLPPDSRGVDSIANVPFCALSIRKFTSLALYWFDIRTVQYSVDALNHELWSTRSTPPNNLFAVLLQEELGDLLLFDADKILLDGIHRRILDKRVQDNEGWMTLTVRLFTNEICEVSNISAHQDNGVDDVRVEQTNKFCHWHLPRYW